MLLDRAKQAFEEQRIESYVTDVLTTRVSMLLRQSYIMAGFKVPELEDLAIITAKLSSGPRTAPAFHQNSRYDLLAKVLFRSTDSN